jgi:hypothetical protein
MQPRAARFGRSHAQAFQDQQVVDAYQHRPLCRRDWRGAMGHRSHFYLLLLLERFQEVSSYVPHASAPAYGFVMGDSVRGAVLQLPENVAAAPFGVGNHPGPDLLPLSCKGGSLWVRRQPSTRFLRSCSRYKVWSPAAGSGTLSSPGSVPVIERSTEKTRMGAGVRDEIKGEQPTAQRKMACCNCSTC